MDLTISPRGAEVRDAARRFVDEHVIPAEAAYASQREELRERGRPNGVPPVLEELTAEARRQGLWNLFLPDVSGLSNLDYGYVAEETGRSPFIAPAAMNCLSPDTGNMELLHLFGDERQKEQWLEPLLDGRIRSGFCMTEPDVASSDATNIATSVRRDCDDYVIDGRKWWTTGAADPRCELLIVMACSDPDGPPHRRHSMILVPRHTPGVRVVRVLPVFGFLEQQGHCEIEFSGVRVPAANLLQDEGDGFRVAQGRLGPGRIHHCMRAVGMAERALDLACRRVSSRTAFGGPLSDQGTVQAQLAESRIEIDQARLLTLHAARLIDTVGAQQARAQIAAIKVAAPRAALNALDRAIQMHGAAGVCDDFPLAEIWSRTRTLRVVDGPDEVHLRTIARAELKPHRHQADTPVPAMTGAQ